MIREKFVTDFMDAVEVDKAITRGEIDVASGTLIMKDLLEYVRKDVETLNQEAKNELDEAIRKLNDTCSKRKDKIKQIYPEPENTMDERWLKMKLLKEDHKRYRQELFFIQDMGYNKGWFEPEK